MRASPVVACSAGGAVKENHCATRLREESGMISRIPFAAPSPDPDSTPTTQPRLVTSACERPEENVP
jgi:hypothetical protein